MIKDEYIKRVYRLGNSNVIIIPAPFLRKIGFDKERHLLKVIYDNVNKRLLIERCDKTAKKEEEKG